MKASGRSDSKFWGHHHANLFSTTVVIKETAFNGVCSCLLLARSGDSRLRAPQGPSTDPGAGSERDRGIYPDSDRYCKVHPGSSPCRLWRKEPAALRVLVWWTKRRLLPERHGLPLRPGLQERDMRATRASLWRYGRGLLRQPKSGLQQQSSEVHSRRVFRRD